MEEIHHALNHIRRGDLNGIEPIVEKYYTTAVRTAFLIVQDRSQAEDVVQSFLLALPKKAKSYDEKRAFEPWFFRSIANAAIDSVCSHTREISYDDLEEIDARIEPLMQSLSNAIERGPEEYLETEEINRMIWKALEQLTPRQRAAIVMRYYLEMNEKEMSQELETSRSNIKWILYSARSKLRKILSMHS